MQSVKDTVLKYWEKVDETFRKITPKNEYVTKFEETTHVPAHYVLMAAVGLFILSFLISLGKSILFVAVLIIPVFFAFASDIINKEHEKKWMYYWICFSIIMIFSDILNLIPFFSYIEIAVSYYFAYFDKEGWFESKMDLLVAYAAKYLGRIFNFSTKSY